MADSPSLRQMTGFLFTSILGTFLHFLFDLTGGSPIAALVSGVNESIFEHMKLLLYPMLLFSFLERRLWGRRDERFWCVRFRGIVLGLALIPALYYTYTGILGVSADWFNITIFFLAAALAYRLQAALSTSDFTCRPVLARAMLVLLVIVFTLLTFFPPRIPFFRDPVTGTYGYFANR